MCASWPGAGSDAKAFDTVTGSSITSIAPTSCDDVDVAVRAKKEAHAEASAACSARTAAPSPPAAPSSAVSAVRASSRR